MNQFITNHQRNIIGVLSGWDRIRFRGTLRLLSAVSGLMAWLFDRRVRLTEFKPFAMELTATLKASVEGVAASAGRSIQYLASSALSKEALVAELLRRENITEGLVCVLSCTEPCQSFEIHRDREQKRIDPVRRLRKCLHWYVYFLDRQLGLCHVRIQSWLPFTVHVCVNGREQLCRQLDRAGLAYVRSDNCLTQVADVAAAQRGEVMSHLGERPEGVRIKHRMNRNSVKMYDKQGSVLRVETTINDARDLGVYRASESDPQGKKKWRRLRKGVVDLPRRGAISQAANLRYLAALSGVEGTTALGQVADDVSRPVIRDGRRCRGLNPMTGDDARLAEVLLRGEFSLNGFRNRDVRTRLFPGSPDPHTIRRYAAKVTRLLRLHRAHGLIRKLNGTQRYQLTAKGRQTLPAFSAARKASTQKLNELAA